MKVGKAKYGGGKKSFKIENGSNVFRILPPLGKNAETGKWYEYYRVEWGYKNSKGQNKPFLDVRELSWKNGSSMVEKESAAHLRREALKKQKAELVDAFKAGQATKDQVQEAADLVKRYNLDAKYYLNAVNLNGEIGLLKINSTLRKALVAEIEKLTKQGVDPLSVEKGVYFDFHRSNETGKIQDWVFSVKPYQENVKAVVNGNEVVVQQTKTHAMDEAFINRLSSEAFELSGMYPTLTNEQVEQLVKAGDNHGALVDQLLGSGEDSPKDTSVAETAVEQRAEAVAETPTTSVTEAAPAAEAAPVAETPAPTQEAAPVAEATTPAPAPTSGAVSDEEFLKSIGAGN